MSDLVLKEENGWFEVTEYLNDLDVKDARQVITELWEYVAKGDVREAASLLDMYVGAELEELIGTDDIMAVKIIGFPDERKDVFYRVWVQRS